MLAKVSAQASHGTCSMDPIIFNKVWARIKYVSVNVTGGGDGG